MQQNTTETGEKKKDLPLNDVFNQFFDQKYYDVKKKKEHHTKSMKTPVLQKTVDEEKKKKKHPLATRQASRRLWRKIPEAVTLFGRSLPSHL